MKLTHTLPTICIFITALLSAPAIACNGVSSIKDCAKTIKTIQSATADEDEFTVAGFNPANHTSSEWVVANVLAHTRNDFEILMYLPGESKPHLIEMDAFKALLSAREITQINPEQVAIPRSYVSTMRAMFLGHKKPLTSHTVVASNR